MDIRFSTLGRVALTVDGVDVRIPGPSGRSVLLLPAGRREAVWIERFRADVWGPEACPPLSLCTHG